MKSELTTKPVNLRNRDAKRIYFEAFTKNERMPYPLMIAMSKLWHTDFLFFYDEKTPVGIIYLAKNRRLVFVMFFAVAQELRGRGYGSAILQCVKEKYRKRIIVSIEPCDSNVSDIDIRKKRKAFYLKNGYAVTGYMMKLSGIEQEILISGGDFNRREFKAFFALYSNGTVWPKIWEHKNKEKCNET